MQCPVCSAELVTTVRENISIDACPSDHGVWLDPDELREVVNRRDLPRTDTEKQAAQAERAAGGSLDSRPGKACPVCSQPMEEFMYDGSSGVMIENCLDHGVWLDSGELEKAEAWIEAASDTYDAPPTNEDAAEYLASSNAAYDTVSTSGDRFGPFEQIVEGSLLRQRIRREAARRNM